MYVYMCILWYLGTVEGAQSKDQAGNEGPKPQTAVYFTRYQSYRFTQAHEVHQKRGVARDVVHVSAVRLTPRSLVPRCRSLSTRSHEKT